MALSEKALENRRKFNRNYYYRNKEKYKATAQIWIKNNPDKVKEKRLKFSKSPKGLYHIMKQNSKRRNQIMLLNCEDFITWYLLENKRCHYCSIFENDPLLKNKRLTIDRLDNNKGYELQNIKLACSNCNSVKGNILTEKEMLRIGKLIMSKRWQTQK